MRLEAANALIKLELLDDEVITIETTKPFDMIYHLIVEAERLEYKLHDTGVDFITTEYGKVTVLGV